MLPCLASTLLLILTVIGSALPLHAQQQPAQDRGLPASSLEPRELHTENWSSIDLATSRLPLNATGGVLLSKVEMTGCTRELLRMQWRVNDPIDLYVIRPVSPKSLPVVLFLYNYTYDTDVFRADRWCDRARQNGFAVAGFASALSPSRIRAPRPLKQWFVSQLQEALATSTHDVQMTLNYLATRGDLDMDRVGIFGQGSGGAIAILAAAADPRIKALDLMDPWGDWPAWLRGSTQVPDQERQLYLQPTFLESVRSLDPVAVLPRLRARALRIQQRTDDLVTPQGARDAMAASLPQTEPGQAPPVLDRFPNLAAEAQALGPNGVLGWFHQQLGRLEHSRAGETDL